eukprot:CAMPEP_0202693288 /NCGR_PEP_ID=MMETSP1385-20130828/7442_1 /ASSEMBLY_ACC=CAM_ASM_000861 /TAXON_ID=933848 /ORGANISM="Elphidium margaritaceum" /LENGTH=1095 /DNA_ID=CAMNT_0049348947 /DNA_START=39 /DNA_END=3326 /DNA_ORIENTATION=-
MAHIPGWSELFRGKCSIYALDEHSKEWRDCGIGGQLVMLQNNQFRSDIRVKWSKNTREILWRLMAGKLKPKGERAWVLKAWDTSRNKQEILAIRFSDQSLSQQFAVKFHQIFPPQQAVSNGPPPLPAHIQQQQQARMQGPFNQFNTAFNQPPPNNFMGNPVLNGVNGFNMNMMGLNGLSMNMAPNNGGVAPLNGYNGFGGGNPAQPQANGGKQAWECAVCTYSNDVSKQACVMCGLSQASAREAAANRSRKHTLEAQPQPLIPTSPNAASMNNAAYFPAIPAIPPLNGGGSSNGPHAQNFNFQEPPLQQQRMLNRFAATQADAGAVTSPVGGLVPSARRGSWICPMCTLHNAISKTHCDACHATRNQQEESSGAVDYRATNPLLNGGGGGGSGSDRAMHSYDIGGMGGGHNAIGGMTGIANAAASHYGHRYTYSQNMRDLGMINHDFHATPNMPEMKISDRMSALAAAHIGPKGHATVQQFQNNASDIACYNDNPSQVFSTLRSVAKKLLKDDVRYRTLDTTNPKVMERLIGFEGVLDFLMLLGFESDAMGAKLICEQKPSPDVVKNAITVLNTYENRMGIGRKGRSKRKKGGGGSGKNGGGGVGGKNGVGGDALDDPMMMMMTDIGDADETAGGDVEDLLFGGGGATTQGGDEPLDDAVNAEEDQLTLEQIIIWSTHENMRDNDSMETLILTHKQFTNSLTFCRNLRRRFDVPIPPDISLDDEKVNEFRVNVQKRIQLKVIKSLRDWMKTYWDDDFAADEELRLEIEEWLAELESLKNVRAKECPWVPALASMVQTEYGRFKLKSPNVPQKEKMAKICVSLESGVPAFLASLPIKKGFKIANVTAEELAEQITLMDYRIFSSIQDRECIGQSWKKKRECAPNVLAMIQQFNNLTVFVQFQILSEKNVRDRGKSIKRVIKMGEKFKELKNYNALCSILGALNSSPIHRLKMAWSKVPPKQLEHFEGFKQIFVNSRNFRNFRTIFRNCSPPAIPYFGLFLQDLVFIDDGNDQFKQIDNFGQHGFMVNFNKCVRTMDRIKNIRLYQINSYKEQIKDNEQLQKVLYEELHKMGKEYDEEKIWKMSTAVKNADEGKKPT